MDEFLPIGILVPMQEEVEQLLQEIERPQIVEFAHRKFYSGFLAGKEVVLAQSGIGKVAASFTATLLVQHFGVKAVVVSGVAGGIATHVKVGDLAIAQQSVQHDMDCRPLFPRYEIPTKGITRYLPHPQLSAILKTAATKFVEEDFSSLVSVQVQTALGILKPNIHLGVLVSGDQFIGTEGQLKEIREGLPDALFVEMEGAAVAQVCHDLGVAFCSIRTISDKADAQAHVDFSKFLNEAAKIYTAGVLKRFVSLL
jgi:adenosylhomocysteine nucleosidase